MARPKLYDSSQPSFVRGLLWLYEFLASLKLAVVLILALAMVLAYATFVEAHLGSKAVQWFLYHSKWFAGLLALLALNIFCAAAIRYPWKRHQTGFVVTHVGLLVLLAGSAISYMGSVNSQMLVFLDDSSQTAVDLDGGGFIQVEGLPGHPETLTRKLDLGPFNWLSPHSVLLGSPPAERTPITIYEDDQTKVEVVDYLARSEVRKLPYMGLHFEQRGIGQEFPLNLEWRTDLPFVEEKMMIGSVLWSQTDDIEDLQRFKECRPNRSVEGDGAVVVWSEGEAHQLDIAELQRLIDEEEGYYELDNGYKVELVTYAPHADLQRLLSTGQLFTQGEKPEMPAVEIKVTVPVEEGEPKEVRMIRLARFPLNTHTAQLEDFYVDFYHPSISARIEIMQGPDDSLAYRAWQQRQKRIVAQGDLKPDETVDTWSMGGGDMVMRMTLERFIPRGTEKEATKVIPLPFDKDADKKELSSRRIKVRVSWDESGEKKSEEFWLSQIIPAPYPTLGDAQTHRIFLPDNNMISCSYNVEQTDVGFAMRLNEFDLEVDPGTTMAGNYTSHLLLLDLRDTKEYADLKQKIDSAPEGAERQKLRDELSNYSREQFKGLFAEFAELPVENREAWVADHDEAALQIVTMNEPLDYPDTAGRPLRFFQENYYPPMPQFDRPLGSVFRVNYDPGRPVKYLGSALITFGIFLMFYMRAYFFKRKPASKKITDSDETTSSASQPELEEVTS